MFRIFQFLWSRLLIQKIDIVDDTGLPKVTGVLALNNRYLFVTFTENICPLKLVGEGRRDFICLVALQSTPVRQSIRWTVYPQLIKFSAKCLCFFLMAFQGIILHHRLYSLGFWMNYYNMIILHQEWSYCVFWWVCSDYGLCLKDNI